MGGDQTPLPVKQADIDAELPAQAFNRLLLLAVGSIGGGEREVGQPAGDFEHLKVQMIAAENAPQQAGRSFARSRPG